MRQGGRRIAGSLNGSRRTCQFLLHKMDFLLALGSLRLRLAVAVLIDLGTVQSHTATIR
jgi:hypothetical protein